MIYLHLDRWRTGSTGPAVGKAAATTDPASPNNPHTCSLKCGHRGAISSA